MNILTFYFVLHVLLVNTTEQSVSLESTVTLDSK